jgi:hypothetical protein
LGTFQNIAKKRLPALIKCPKKGAKIAQKTASRPIKGAISTQKGSHFLRKMDIYCIFRLLTIPPKGSKKRLFCKNRRILFLNSEI